jgi:transposase
MRKQLYWLSDEEWRRLEPLLPHGRRGAHRVDDRRVISGIMHMLRSGARWRDCPPEYGPYTTIYNRFVRWSRQGIWLAMFKALTGSAAVFGTALINSSHVKAHRSAGGGKRGPLRKRSGARGAAAQPRSTR